MNIQRKLAVTVLLGTGVGLSGCQAPSAGGMAFWKKSDTTLASTTPDVGKQRYDGLAKEFGKTPPKAGLGGSQPAESDNFLTASWKKATGALTPKNETIESSDPLRLDQPFRKMGPEVYVGAAQLMENQSKWAEAEVQYQKALKQAPNDLNALVGLARMHDRQGHTQEAVGYYQRAMKAHPNSGLVLNDLGLCFARQRQFENALGAMTRAVELSPENPKYRNNLATVLVEMGRVDDAVKALSSVASPAVAHYNVGYMLSQKQGQNENAARHFQQALALDPGLSPARDMLAQLAGNAGAQAMAQPAARAVPVASQYETAQAPPRAAAQQYFEVPQVEVPAQASPTRPSGPAGYHLTDDAPPSAETASQTNKWGNYATQPLPPVE